MGSVILSLVLLGVAGDPQAILEEMVAKVDLEEKMGGLTCGASQRWKVRNEAFAAAMEKEGPKAIDVLERALEDTWARGGQSRFADGWRAIYFAYGRLGKERALTRLLSHLGPESGTGILEAIREAAGLSYFGAIYDLKGIRIFCVVQTPLVQAMHEVRSIMGDRWMYLGVRLLDEETGEYEFVDERMNRCGKGRLEEVRTAVTGCVANARPIEGNDKKKLFGKE